MKMTDIVTEEKKVLSDEERKKIDAYLQRVNSEDTGSVVRYNEETGKYEVSSSQE